MLNTFPLASFYTQPPLSHSLFREEFTENSNTYKRLEQFSYDRLHCTTDHIHTLIGKDDNYDSDDEDEDDYDYWIYIGEMKKGTDDIPQGIGIKVWSNGLTQQLKKI